jgi:NAD(P)H-hydrate repair Nnr-like enzyme with NAD(P)H-hydrate epimerase domain
MASTAQELQLLAGSQTIHDFNQVIDALLGMAVSGTPTPDV